jgi:osmotically-inducible protein OsmY
LRIDRGIFAALAALLLTVSTACSALRRPEPPVDRTHDPRIKREVEARLAREPALGPTIRVEVDGAVVVLHGSVQGIAAWQCALRNAQLVEGVLSVTDYLVLERGPREIRCLGVGTVAGR